MGVSRGAATLAAGIALGAGAVFVTTAITEAAYGAQYPHNPTWAQARQYVGESDWRTIRYIARCEQPGPERPWGVRWSHPGPQYVGGLGMWKGTAAIAAGATGTPIAQKATPAQQVLQAHYIGHRFGWNAWGCY